VANSATGKLTTHVLDTAYGCPAANLKIELWRIDVGQQNLEQQEPGQQARSHAISLVKTMTTNSDGRCDAPLLAGSELAIGTYELRFAIGDYFTAKPIKPPNLTNPLFLDIVPMRFGIADTSIHYHVPLLCSPWAYSTYRGS
jgi:5-hydroxyisourate hydrolase